MADLAARVDRLESTEQIRQLASKYALALDMRDIDALVNLYVEDMRINKKVSGRQALKRVFCEIVRIFSSWVEFWAGPSRDRAAPPAPAARDQLLDTIRRGERRPKPPNFSWMKD